MSGLGVHISVNNVPQFDRLQSNAHRAPAVHQVKNAEIANARVEQQLKMPTQPDEAEGKNIDPEDRKKDRNRSRKKTKKEKKKGEASEENKTKPDSGSLIDIEA